MTVDYFAELFDYDSTVNQQLLDLLLGKMILAKSLTVEKKEAVGT